MKANSVILINVGSLIGTTGVTSVLGIAYWWFAARQFPPETVGLASAEISTMTLLGTLCMTGLGTLLIGELPRQPGKEMSLISAALILVGGIGGFLGIVFALIAPFISPNFQALRASAQIIGLFTVGVSLTAITLALDQAFIGLLRGELQLWRNTLFAVIKLVALLTASLWLTVATSQTIYITWTVGNALSLVVLVLFKVKKGNRPIKSYWPNWGLLKKLKSAALQHQMLNLILQAPSLILPVLVTIVLSSRMNAWFYVAMMISNFVSVATLALTTVLYAANSAQPEASARKARLTISLSLATCLLANIVFLFGSRQILGLFGQTYADQASWSLRILVIASIPLVIKNHYIAIRRIQGQVAKAMLPLLVGGILELTGAALGARLGSLFGLSLGWLVAVCIEAACMLLPVCKALRITEVPLQPCVETANVEPELIWLADTLVLPAVKLKQVDAEKYKRYQLQSGNTQSSHGDRPHLRPIRLQAQTPHEEDRRIHQDTYANKPNFRR